MAARPSTPFPFIGSDSNTYTGYTIPLDADGLLTVNVAASMLAQDAATASNQTAQTNVLNNIANALIAAIPSGANIIGQVGIDQSTPGTSNKVSIGSDGSVVVSSSALPAGASTASNQNLILSKLSNIDLNTSDAATATNQSSILTTLNTISTNTNGLSSAQASANTTLTTIAGNTSVQLPLVSSSAVIGKVTIDQSTPGTTNKVSIGNDGSVYVSSSALPLGAATANNQATANGSLSSIVTNTNVLTNINTNTAYLSGINANISTIAANSSVQPPLVAGTAIIGKIGIDQTTPGTTNKVSIGTDGTVVVTSLPSLSGGTAIIGKVGIDQTTPGTTNKVSIGSDGSVTVASSALPSGAATAANQTTELVKLDTVNSNLSQVISNTGVQLPLVTGSALIGKVGIDQTTPGTTNKVSIGTDGSVTVSALPTTAATSTLQTTGNGYLSQIVTNTGTQQSLVSGSAIIGKVGIDQTTPGTTNKVSIGTDGSVAITSVPTTLATTARQDVINSTLNTILSSVSGQTPAGSNIIGKVGIDQTTPGVTNKISIDQTTPGNTNKVYIGSDGSVSISSLPKIPAGSNIIGQVTIDQSIAGTTNKVSIGTDGSVAINNLPSTTVIVGDVLSGANDTGKAPIKIGGIARTTNTNTVSDGQRVSALFDKAGRIVSVGAIREARNIQYTFISSTTETTIVNAGATGVYNDIHGLVLTNLGGSVTTATIRDATGGNTIAIYSIQPNSTAGFTLPVDSAWKQSVTASNWTITISASSLAVTANFVATM